MHFDMLCAPVDHWVSSQMDTAHVVAVKENRILDETCSDDHALVLGFCAPQCDCRELLAALGGTSVTEGEGEP